MLRDRAILDFPEADVDGDGSTEQGRFVFAGNLEITPAFRTGFLVGGVGSNVNSVLQTVAGQDGEKGKGFYIDLGGGAHTVEIAFRGWTGAEIPSSYDSDGNPTSYEPVQWGDTGDPSQKTATDMTGEAPLSQINLLEEYLRQVRVDSESPATLQYGEYSESGVYEPLSVVLEGPEMTRAAEDGSWFDGTLTLIEAGVFNEALDAAKQLS